MSLPRHETYLLVKIPTIFKPKKIAGAFSDDHVEYISEDDGE